MNGTLPIDRRRWKDTLAVRTSDDILLLDLEDGDELHITQRFENLTEQSNGEKLVFQFHCENLRVDVSDWETARVDWPILHSIAADYLEEVWLLEETVDVKSDKHVFFFFFTAELLKDQK